MTLSEREIRERHWANPITNDLLACACGWNGSDYVAHLEEVQNSEPPE